MEQAKAEEEDFTALPLPDKLTHKLWKARMAGYEELAQLLKRLDPEEPGSVAQFKKYSDYMKKIAAESNAFAQEAGLVVLTAWAQNSPLAVKTRSVILPVVIEKSLAQTRAGTRAKALDVLMMYIEIDTAEPVVVRRVSEAGGLPKLVAGAVFALKETATQLVLELYRWLGQAVETCLGDLKPSFVHPSLLPEQQKELLEAFRKVPPEKPAPERLLRSQQEVAAQEGRHQTAHTVPASRICDSKISVTDL
ncbi:MAG: hypothetical protein BJ554DRAFT_6399, partial [Olpidium bornovanus]